MAFTIANQNRSFFSKIKPALIYLLLFLVLGAIAYGVTVGMQEIPGIKQKAYITAETIQESADVYIDGEKIGQTPIQTQEVSSGTHTVKIQSTENPLAVYSTKVDFLPTIEVTFQRDLGVSDLFSSGRDFWMEKGRTNLTVISQPSGAEVTIDGSGVGVTPLSLDKITEGDYELSIKSTGYETQSARISVKKDYNLNVSAQLFPTPIPPRVTAFEGSQNLYDLTINNEIVAKSPERARAVAYWNKTRGIEIDGTQTKEPVFTYFIDQAGNVYDKEGEPITTPERLEALKREISLASQIVRGGYLGEDTSTPGLTPPAKEAYEDLTGQTQSATVLPTGLGWLRVRTGPSLNSSELTRVNVGETLPVLETQTGWIKVQTPEGEGWVSSDYIELSQ